MRSRAPWRAKRSRAKVPPKKDWPVFIVPFEVVWDGTCAVRAPNRRLAEQAFNLSVEETADYSDGLSDRFPGGAKGTTAPGGTPSVRILKSRARNPKPSRGKVDIEWDPLDDRL